MRFGTSRSGLNELLLKLVAPVGLVKSSDLSALRSTPWFSGVLGVPDEIQGSAEESIEKAASDAFTKARAIFKLQAQAIAALIALVPVVAPQEKVHIEHLGTVYSSVMGPMANPSWIILEFVRQLHWAHCAGHEVDQSIRSLNRDLSSARSFLAGRSKPSPAGPNQRRAT
jgi:hypothetical protein